MTVNDIYTIADTLNLKITTIINDSPVVGSVSMEVSIVIRPSIYAYLNIRKFRKQIKKVKPMNVIFFISIGRIL